MASGTSGRNNSGSKGYDFATDDILCSYEDFGNQDSANGSHSDSGIGSNSSKEFHKSRMARTPMFPAPTYSPPEESLSKDVISSVEKTMKKYTDNILRFLEGVSSRLSQLELYCYNLDKSIGEMRSDLVRDNEEADIKLKSLEKHLQEVHRSVQILRDKQELAETQKELAKLQLAQKESSSGHSQQNEEKATSGASDTKKSDNTAEVHGQQLALALPHQVAPQPSLPTRPVEQQQPIATPPPQGVSQSQPYYLHPSQIPNPPVPTQPPQGQYLPSDSPYRTPQTQEVPRVPPQPAQSQVNQVQPLPQYQQQWPQQLQQQSAPLPSSMQPPIRPSSTTLYAPYLPSQTANPSPPETIPNSMPMQVSYSGIPQPGASRAEATPYGYGGPGRPVQHPLPPQQLKNTYGVQNDGYTASGPHPPLSSGNAYMMYQNEGGRAHHPHQSHFAEGSYPPTSVSLQGPQSNAGAILVRPPQFMRNHPYNELIDKLVGMGYRGDHVASVIQRLEESGQPVDFNAVLDVLNGHSSGGSQRGWSG